MAYDLIIRNGTIVDGTGLPRYRSDVGITGGRVTKLGSMDGEAAVETLDAEGMVVAPGFIDGHTHVDAQIFWNKEGSNSCWHGVTSVIMGNCGFTLAPGERDNKERILRSLLKAEDIALPAIEAGIEWTWSSFGDYLGAIDSVPKGINYGGYVGHSAVRAHVMGERAFSEAATDEDLARMKREVASAIRAGALGFSTSRSPSHTTPAGDPVASRIGDWAEVCALVEVLGELGAGVFQLAYETQKPDGAALQSIEQLSLATRVPLTVGLSIFADNNFTWQEVFRVSDRITDAGGRALVQTTVRELTVMLSFETQMPFDMMPAWQSLRRLPLADQERRLRDPATRKVLIAEAERRMNMPVTRLTADHPKPVWERCYVYDRPLPPFRSIADIAAERGGSPIEVMIDIALEGGLKTIFFLALANLDQSKLLAAMRHPRSVPTFSDTGAHVTQICDSNLQTWMLAYWVRDRQVFTLEQAVRKMSYELASFWKLEGRGLLREGNVADIVVFDAEHVAPLVPTIAYDLPAQQPRIVQGATGIAATIVNGFVTTRNGRHTGNYFGQVLRGPMAQR
jgi:N-acyl-D-amino-acid deacylase